MALVPEAREGEGVEGGGRRRGRERRRGWEEGGERKGRREEQIGERTKK